MCLSNWGTIHNITINGHSNSYGYGFNTFYPPFYGMAGFSPSCFGFGFSPFNNFGFGCGPQLSLEGGLGFGLGFAASNFLRSI